MKTHHGAFKAAGAFQAAARPLYAGAVHRPPRVAGATGTEVVADRRTLLDLAEGPYFVLALLLDAAALCRTDGACRLLRQLNRAGIGPWRALGVRVFHGLELEREGTFEQPVSGPSTMEVSPCGSAGGRKLARIDWKGRFNHFRTDVPTFCAPFIGAEISAVANPDEVAYFRCRLCTDALDSSSEIGVYLEVEVLANPDNLSMAIVDFEAGGCSSVTFSPDTGAVIRERKVREAPRKVDGAYIQPLATVPPGQRFHGLMGLYLHRGQLAFFRRCYGKEAHEPSTGAYAPPGSTVATLPAEAVEARDLANAGDVSRATQTSTGTPGFEVGPWETTGFVSDLGWAEGRRLTPCLAFRDEGTYHVRVVCVRSEPPVPLEHTSAAADSDMGWSGFDWEVGADAVDA
mmetsp:Transcript_140223/g.349524  ORF Transcript_140223/g.349524 Transcript_140223/m.349524 type:complete len:402 (+) Transcript_140223:37-1242(+)